MGPHRTVDSILASRPAAPGSILCVPKIFLELSWKILDVVEIYQQRALLRQWTVQSLIVDRTHPALVRAVLQKRRLNWNPSEIIQAFLPKVQIVQNYFNKNKLRFLRWLPQ